MRINGGVNSVVALDSTSADITNTTTRVFALKVNSSNVNGSGGTLVIGDDVNPGGLILDNGSSINTTNLAFGPTGLSEGIIWAGGSTATVNLNWSGLSPATRYAGVLTFSDGTSNIGQTIVNIG